jgi:hypothetical protein
MAKDLLMRNDFFFLASFGWFSLSLKFILVSIYIFHMNTDSTDDTTCIGTDSHLPPLINRVNAELQN